MISDIRAVNIDYECSLLHSTEEAELKEGMEQKRDLYDVAIPTRLLTVLSSPPCRALASTETVTNSSVLAFTAQAAVWSIHVIKAGCQKTENTQRNENT